MYVGVGRNAKEVRDVAMNSKDERGREKGKKEYVGMKRNKETVPKGTRYVRNTVETQPNSFSVPCGTEVSSLSFSLPFSIRVTNQPTFFVVSSLVRISRLDCVLLQASSVDKSRQENAERKRWRTAA